MRSIPRFFAIGLMMSVGGLGHAEEITVISPALEAYPSRLLEEFRGCVATVESFSARPYPERQVEAWFKDFRLPAYARLLEDVRNAQPAAQRRALDRAHSTITALRRRLDFRTEQPLIALMDAAVINRGNEPQCRATVAKLVVRIAAQRDRAWAWADAMERILAMDIAKWNTEIRQRRVEESLRVVEQAYQRFER